MTDMSIQFTLGTKSAAKLVFAKSEWVSESLFQHG